ncbi:hypothetical protein COY87_04935 [Candidatus Roizmanbacteria bacterium CG_4_10_14_0_8_um_filter_33_9]|uniref:Uncharacterized protein n=1 Tax=Candidatus Roizmanbacteria bacterium CG_4_10_14_0_8_um_filter_33_9 TaxID=1974826 RepID=A0A2M7QH59_9BACT|nr:MAG: hypothetical protein COY87_04935 [Candidatus Roizmanbacteria bacterium CG_4_10_14_0_8_um_filter_33_9]
MSFNGENPRLPAFPSRNFRRVINVVNFAIPPSLAGFYQFYAETHGSKPGPFNLIEEFAEGSIPALMGGLAMLGLYSYLKRKANLDHDTDTMGKCIAYGTGALIGYMGMVIVGILVHQTSGIADIKWEPFK